MYEGHVWHGKMFGTWARNVPYDIPKFFLLYETKVRFLHLVDFDKTCFFFNFQTLSGRCTKTLYFQYLVMMEMSRCAFFFPGI